MGLEVPPAKVDQIDQQMRMVTENLFSKVVALEAEGSSEVAEDSVTFLGPASRVEQ